MNESGHLKPIVEGVTCAERQRLHWSLKPSALDLWPSSHAPKPHGMLLAPAAAAGRSWAEMEEEEEREEMCVCLHSSTTQITHGKISLFWFVLQWKSLHLTICNTIRGKYSHQGGKGSITECRSSFMEIKLTKLNSNLYTNTVHKIHHWKSLMNTHTFDLLSGDAFRGLHWEDWIKSMSVF